MSEGAVATKSASQLSERGTPNGTSVHAQSQDLQVIYGVAPQAVKVVPGFAPRAEKCLDLPSRNWLLASAVTIGREVLDRLDQAHS